MKKSRLLLPLKFAAFLACMTGLVASALAAPQAASTQTDTSSTSTAKKRHSRKKTDTSTDTMQGTAAADSSSSTASHRHRKTKSTATDTAAAQTAAPATATSPSVAASSASTSAKTSRAAKGTQSAAMTPAKTVSAGDIQAARASGKVWVNTDTKVYHKDDKWYGATKTGKFMSEQDAIKAGYRAAKSGGSQ